MTMALGFAARAMLVIALLPISHLATALTPVVVLTENALRGGTHSDGVRPGRAADVHGFGVGGRRLMAPYFRYQEFSRGADRLQNHEDSTPSQSAHMTADYLLPHRNTSPHSSQRDIVPTPGMEADYDGIHVHPPRNSDSIEPYGPPTPQMEADYDGIHVHPPRSSDDIEPYAPPTPPMEADFENPHLSYNSGSSPPYIPRIPHVEVGHSEP